MIEESPSIEYSSDYDANYLNSIISQAKNSWADIGNADEWLRELHGKIF
jgi:hypothetical protein